MANELNKNEYGQVLRINFNQDVSGATDLTFLLEPKYGTEVSKTNLTGVTVGSSNVDVGDSSYLANEFIEYTIESTDLDYAGQYRMKGKAKLSATNEIVSDYVFFNVLA